MRFLELNDIEAEGPILVNMDKVMTIVPDVEDEGGFFNTELKTYGSVLYFDDGNSDPITVKETMKEILELSKGL